MHTVAILALDGVVAFDLSTPIEVFGRTYLPDGQAAYRVQVCASNAEVNASTFILHVPWRLDMLAEADTIILPGLADPMAPIGDDVVVALRAAVARGVRIASICVGAFTLAATGLLDGLRATTHWAATGELARRYPKVEVDANVLFVDNGQILTSAGAAAVAAEAARISVMTLEREGGQAQFIAHEPPIADGVTLGPLLRWMEENAYRSLRLEDIATQEMMSTRTLSRLFHEDMGTTPLQWLNRSRLRRAQCLLETTDHAVDWIGSQVGFGSATTFRDRFKQLVGVSPQAYRRAFRGITTK